jgi:hypothetical protein
LHDDHAVVDPLDFMLTGMVGEVGEFANNIKKLWRLQSKLAWLYDQGEYANHAADIELCQDQILELQPKIIAEHTDILCYWLNLGGVMGHNLEAAWRENRRNNATRWG